MGLFGPSKKEKALQCEVERLTNLLLPEQKDCEKLKQQISDLKSTISDLNKIIDDSNNKIVQLNMQAERLDHEILEKQRQLSVYEVDINALDYGLYKPTFQFANSDLYKEKLNKLRDSQKQFIKNDNAVYASTDWKVNGSLTQGRIMVNNYKKLLLRAFNIE